MALTPRELVKQGLLEAKKAANEIRKTGIEKRLDIYYDHWEGYLIAEIKKQFQKKNADRIKLLTDISQNVLKRITKEISMIYKNPAVRQLDTEGADKIYQDIINAIDINTKLKTVNRLTNLCNECIVRIVWRNNRIEYDILTPNIIDVVQNQDNLTEPDAIIYEQNLVDTVDSDDRYFIYWDVYGQLIKFDKDYNALPIQGNEGNENPYQDPNNPGRTILPFVVFHRDANIDSIWDCTSGEDMVSGTIQIAVLLTYVNYLIKVQSFKQIYVTGKDINLGGGSTKLKGSEGESGFVNGKYVKKGIDNSESPADDVARMALDPLSLFTVNGDGVNIGVLDLKTAVSDIWDIIDKKIANICNNYGISMENFRITGNATSGYQLKLSNRALIEIREDQVPFYRAKEQELFLKTAIIYNYHAKQQIPLTSKFSIDFCELKFEDDPLQSIDIWERRIQNNVANKLQWIMEDNPDIKTEEEAEKVYNKNREINERVKGSISDIRETMRKNLQNQGIIETGTTQEGKP